MGFYKKSFQVLIVIENSLEFETEFQLKGMLRPILTHIKAGDEKACKIYLKKLFFQNVLVLIFFIEIITSVILPTQIACDVMCVHHVIH